MGLFIRHRRRRALRARNSAMPPARSSTKSLVRLRLHVQFMAQAPSLRWLKTCPPSPSRHSAHCRLLARYVRYRAGGWIVIARLAHSANCSRGARRTYRPPAGILRVPVGDKGKEFAGTWPGRLCGHEAAGGLVKMCSASACAANKSCCCLRKSNGYCAGGIRAALCLRAWAASSYRSAADELTCH